MTLAAILALAENNSKLGQSTLRLVNLQPELVAALVRVVMAAEIMYRHRNDHLDNALHDLTAALEKV